jgi:site-specific recombinase XerD
MEPPDADRHFGQALRGQRRAWRRRARAALGHLIMRAGWLAPHVLRHDCASELGLSGDDFISIRETLGHSSVATTMRYLHLDGTEIEDAWMARKSGLSSGRRDWSR